ncbi:MAG: hypothetical protein LBG14_00070, partial [Treponema sp.]|nr:hypothetical protein [Treponema sp.]
MEISPWSRRAAQVCSWLALFAGMLVIYGSFVLFDFFPPAAAGARVQIYLLNFGGMALGAALCPLFLPLPCSSSGETFPGVKNPGVSVVFIFLVILPNLVVRSLGVTFWLGSIPARILMALSSGMIQPISCGLFYITRLQTASRPSYSNRTGPYASALFALVIMAAVIIRGGTMPLLEHFGLTPLGAMTLLFNALKWIVLCLGFSASACVLVMGGQRVVNPGEQGEDLPTDWKMIARLTGLAATFFMLNSLLEMRLFPLVSGAGWGVQVYFPGVFLLGFLAGRSVLFVEGKMGSFLRFLLILMILLFILLPVLHFLNAEYPLFALVMSSLVSI